MKPYFAKYLPVEGVGKIGDIVINIHSKIITTITEDNKSIILYDFEKYYKKLKMFLCSLYIKDGDEVFEPGLELEGIIRVAGVVPFDSDYSKKPISRINLDYALEKGAYKILGQISYFAIWVKDGNEFDEDEIRYNKCATMLGQKWEDAFYYLIKCPTCNSEFKEQFKSNILYPNALFYKWHTILTGSCESGKKHWLKEHGINLNDSMTVEQFVELTKNAYGGEIISGCI